MACGGSGAAVLLGVGVGVISTVDTASLQAAPGEALPPAEPRFVVHEQLPAGLEFKGLAGSGSDMAMFDGGDEEEEEEEEVLVAAVVNCSRTFLARM